MSGFQWKVECTCFPVFTLYINLCFYPWEAPLWLVEDLEAGVRLKHIRRVSFSKLQDWDFKTCTLILWKAVAALILCCTKTHIHTCACMHSLFSHTCTSPHSWFHPCRIDSCLCASARVPDCLCLTARKENPSGFNPPHPKGLASKKRAFPSLLSSQPLCSISRCFSYITAERVLIWPGRRDRGESVGSFRVLPRSTAIDAFPKLRRQASHVAWTRLIPNKRGGRLRSQRTQLQHNITLLLPFLELPLCLCIPIHNSVMLYLYLSPHICHKMGGMWVQVHTIKLVQGVYMSAFSFASSCHWNGLRSRLSLTKGNGQLQNRPALVGLIWRHPKLRGDHSELYCVIRVCISAWRNTGCLGITTAVELKPDFHIINSSGPFAYSDTTWW